jgi:hypothetical protein
MGLRLRAMVMWARKVGGQDELMWWECSIEDEGPFIGLGEGAEVVKAGKWAATRWRSMAE